MPIGPVFTSVDDRSCGPVCGCQVYPMEIAPTFCQEQLAKSIVSRDTIDF
jgi:hypothetical protein